MGIERKPMRKCAGISTFLLLSAAFVMASFVCVGPAYAARIQTGVVVTAAQDYTSGATSVISVDPVGGPRSVQNNLLPTISDLGLSAYNRYFYRVEKYNADNVTKFDIDAPATPIWQYSTQDTGEFESSNPYQLVFVNSEKAYLLRYGSTKAWIVNPSTTTEAGFKIGELDLSAYADADGAPEMAAGVITNGKLFIMMERLENWCPSTTAYVAVFDVATDTEIDTGLGEGGRKGIPLPIKDPVGIHYLPDNETIYVLGKGPYPGSCAPQYDYTGGIISLDPVSYATAMIVDDGDAEHHPYGVLTGMEVISSTKGYFVGYAGWGDNSLYTFDTSTGLVAGPLDAFKNISIGGMNSGLGLDQNDMLWVTNQTHARIDIVNTLDDTIDESLGTNLNPQAVAFCIQLVSKYLYVKPDGQCDGMIPCYATVQDAVIAAETVDIIRIAQADYPEDVVVNEAKKITFQSGWNAGYEEPSGESMIHSLVLIDGTLVLDKGRLVAAGRIALPAQ